MGRRMIIKRLPRNTKTQMLRACLVPEQPGVSVFLAVETIGALFGDDVNGYSSRRNQAAGKQGSS